MCNSKIRRNKNKTNETSVHDRVHLPFEFTDAKHRTSRLGTLQIKTTMVPTGALIDIDNRNR